MKNLLIILFTLIVNYSNAQLEYLDQSKKTALKELSKNKDFEFIVDSGNVVRYNNNERVFTFVDSSKIMRYLVVSYFSEQEQHMRDVFRELNYQQADIPDTWVFTLKDRRYIVGMFFSEDKEIMNLVYCTLKYYER